MKVFVFLAHFKAILVEKLVIFAALRGLNVRTQMNGLQVILL